MPITRDWIATQVVDMSQDAVTKLITQDAESTSSTVNGLTTPAGAVAEIAVGQEFTMLARAGIGENSPAAVTTYRTPFHTAKSAPFQYRILEVGFEVIDITVADWTDGDAGNLDLTVIRGDGAASEVESDVIADFALDDDYANGSGLRWPTAAVVFANNTVVSGGSLYVDILADPDATAGATNDGVIIDTWVRCMRTL